MSKNCEIKIQFNNNKRSYITGEKVSGNDIFTANETFDCRKLEITYQWSTHGKGNVSKQIIDTCIDPPGRLIAGREYKVPFSFTVSHYPITYHGEYVNVDHCIHARADVAWKIDPTAFEEFLVGPGNGCTAAYTDKSKVPSKMTGKQGVFIGYLIFFVVIIAFLFLMLPFAIIGILIFAIYKFKQYLVKKKLGNIVVNFPNKPVSRGETIPVTITFTPEDNFIISKIACTLECEELAVSGSGTNKTTHKKAVVKLESATAENYAVERKKSNSFTLTLTIPQDAPYSFDILDNHVNWNYSLYVHIPSWPDYRKNFKVLVFPKE